MKAVVIAASLLLAATSFAADPWKDKSYQEWSADDVRKILNHSPWAKSISYIGLTEPPSDEDTGVDARGSHSAEATSGDTEAAGFVVRWMSSRSLRRALARGQALQNQFPANQIEQHVLPDPDEYILTVTGADMSAFGRNDEATLKAKSYMSVKGKPKLSPTRVEIARAQNGAIKAIVFHFPRRDASGQRILEGNEKSVLFDVRGGDRELTVNFEPRKMVNNAGPDL